MRKPSFGKPRSASGAFSLSRRLPRLKMPLSAAEVPAPRPRPQVGRPGLPLRPPLPPPNLPQSAPAPQRTTAATAAGAGRCTRCGHPESDHPVRYACDKYPHPDPLRLCGCEAEALADPCPACGHSGRHHKPRHRCHHGDDCHCWGYEGVDG